MNTALRQNTTSTMASKTGFAWLLVINLFFLWSFPNNLNLFLAPHFRNSFPLAVNRSILIGLAVYTASFPMSLTAADVMKGGRRVLLEMA